MKEIERMAEVFETMTDKYYSGLHNPNGKFCDDDYLDFYIALLNFNTIMEGEDKND